jgi:hypothetical protein
MQDACWKTGNRQPHGLVLHFREAIGLGGGLNLQPWADEYVANLRDYVDLWLATGRSEGAEHPATRHPTVRISRIVEDVVTANKVEPRAFKDGYGMGIRAVRRQPDQEWQWQSKNAQPKQKTSLKRTQYSSEIEYLREVYKEQLAELSAANEKSALEPDTTMEDDLHADDSIATIAAERIFVEMLMSDWRLKIAKCVNPACGTYFQLKKWNQPYEKGTRCSDCRNLQEDKDKQRRVESNRKKASGLLATFVAEHFARKISSSEAWYRDDADLKRNIVDALNSYIEGDNLLKTIYPQSITTKWLVRAKNRNAIKRRMAKNAAEAVPGSYRSALA